MESSVLSSSDQIASAPGLHQYDAAKDPTQFITRSSFAEQVEAACKQACQAIAPSWPLDRAIAVNPHWSRIGRPVREVAARMAVLGTFQVFPTRRYLLNAWSEGRISSSDLRYALKLVPAAKSAQLTESLCLESLGQPASLPRLPLLIDVLDEDPERHNRLSWRQAITHQVSQTCATYFDEYQAEWQPQRTEDLYTFWRETLTHDHGIGVLMGIPELDKSLHALPLTRQDAERWVLHRLDLPVAVWADYLEAVLLTVNGWASWCAYLGWQAGQSGQTDSNLRDLLAIRLAWGAILLECKDDAVTRRALATVQAEWSRASALLKQAEEMLLVDEVWQVALEAGFQRQLAHKLGRFAPEAAMIEAEKAIDVQAAFCIDVRSEPMRRALETVSPQIQTIGFAGFFGLPIAYTPFATTARRPQLPGLLAPAAEVTDRISVKRDSRDINEDALNEAARKSRRSQFARSEPKLAASCWPAAAFSYVEAAGIFYLGKLAGWLNPSERSCVREDLSGLATKYKSICRPMLTGLDIESKVSLASRVLHALGLDHKLSPLVLFVGHGSQSSNNAHASSLDCGACCGQTGEVNARVLAQLLNDSDIRSGLHAYGITIPEQTTFVAALHNTTTDEIEGFDLDLLPPAARIRWDRLQSVFAVASDRVRRERALALGIDPLLENAELLKRLRRRANDGAQTRPEWGLSGNAAFIIAPRHRSKELKLDGRCFLHDYDAQSDPDGSILELLMTAPMLVTHWINWQYHASTCDPMHLGSGNKLLHNVVGGHIGVFEGNGGDLRIGLAQQSLHDGQRWVHEPLRLTVVIDAPQQAIDNVIRQHSVVRQLLENGWLHLWCFEDSKLVHYVDQSWQDLELGAA